MTKSTIKKLEKQAYESRKMVLDMIYKAGTGHIGSDFSCADILTTLYGHVLNLTHESTNNPNRDQYVQSKGHAVEILWVTLANYGYIDKKELETYSKFKSRLLGHPNNEVNGIEMNTGSLGHGLGVSVGISLAGKLDEKDYKTYTLLGDGELAEGSVWEAAMAASQYKLSNLTAIIDHNGIQISGTNEQVMTTAPLKEKWEAFGWYVIEADGNDISSLINAFSSTENGNKPKLIIAHTVKGKGVDFMENQVGWHHRVPTEEEYIIAQQELDRKILELEAEV